MARLRWHPLRRSRRSRARTFAARRRTNSRWHRPVAHRRWRGTRGLRSMHGRRRSRHRCGPRHARRRHPRHRPRPHPPLRHGHRGTGAATMAALRPAGYGNQSGQRKNQTGADAPPEKDLSNRSSAHGPLLSGCITTSIQWDAGGGAWDSKRVCEPAVPPSAVRPRRPRVSGFPDRSGG